METIDVENLSTETVTEIFQKVPFIKSVLEVDSLQRPFFLKNSKIFDAEPGEEIIKRGEFNHWVYFLMVGQLLVYPEFSDKRNHMVNFISAGEMFGEMAIIREFDRNMTLIADPNCRKIIYMGTNFSAFGKIDDFSAVSISTKILFYLSAISVIRKRLEIMKIDYPDSDLVQKSVALKPYTGEKNSLHELLYLQDQAKFFTKRLVKWNRSLEFESNFYGYKVWSPEKLLRKLKNKPL